MKMIYDIVLNFSEINNYHDFYEWQKEDFLTYIEKIPIIRVNSTQMMELSYNRILLSSTILKKIENKTYSVNESLPYCTLFTDTERVIAFEFDQTGLLKRKSSLVLDEEDDVLKESQTISEEKVSYKKIEKVPISSFFSRKEQKIQNYLIKEINTIYQNKEYEIIHYLYHEISTKKRNTEEEYQFLINTIEHNYQKSYQELSEIIHLIKNENRTNCY